MLLVSETRNFFYGEHLLIFNKIFAPLNWKTLVIWQVWDRWAWFSTTLSGHVWQVLLIPRVNVAFLDPDIKLKDLPCIILTNSELSKG